MSRHAPLNTVIHFFDKFNQCAQQDNSIGAVQELCRVLQEMRLLYTVKDKEYLWREHMAALLNNPSSYITDSSDLEEVFRLLLAQTEDSGAYWDYCYKFLQEIHSYCKNYNLEIKDCVRKNYLDNI